MRTKLSRYQLATNIALRYVPTFKLDNYPPAWVRDCIRLSYLAGYTTGKNDAINNTKRPRRPW